jgi:hypothetical protein
MLRRVTVPLLHQYALPAFEAGPDLTWLCMTPTEARDYRSKLLQTISSATEALYGPQPQPPPRLVLLQNTVSVCAERLHFLPSLQPEWMIDMADSPEPDRVQNGTDLTVYQVPVCKVSCSACKVVMGMVCVAGQRGL